MICPQCRSIHVRRSRRVGIEAVLSMIFLRPFRCRDCHHRFLRWSVTSRQHPAAPIQDASTVSIADRLKEFSSDV